MIDFGSILVLHNETRGGPLLVVFRVRGELSWFKVELVRLGGLGLILEVVLEGELREGFIVFGGVALFKLDHGVQERGVS